VKHVFGPVPSRRLGFSLGVDPLVPKTCSLDCVYCELGPTTDRTVSRCPYADMDEVLDELRDRLAERPKLDFVTVSGSGEPTLSSDLGTLIEGIRAMTDTPVAVLTNGTLMTDPEVSEALLMADVVAPSLDAVSREVFERVNRPHPSLDPEAIAEAIAAFSAAFKGGVWLETVFVEGMNDDSGEIALLTERAATINPERMHINTVVRPPAVSGARPVGRPRLQEIAAMFGPRAEVIASPSSETQSARDGDEVGVVVEMAARRPVTAGDVAKVVGISQAAAAKLLVRLEERGVLSVVRHGENLYYRK
jgi:wyosine [tRNA(Phe)-imidazoG37] synthetase (radical SAM superfamily)